MRTTWSSRRRPGPITPGCNCCAPSSPRHCEPTGPRGARPDDRLREAIHGRATTLDCFVASLLAMTEERAEPNNFSLGLWVPAFAGTTAVNVFPTCKLICPTGAARTLLSTLVRKNIPIYRNSDLAYIASIPPRLAEGRFADVTRRGAGMRWTWTRCPTSSVRRVRRSGVVLAPPRSGAKFAGDASRIMRATVANGKVHRGERL